MSFEMLLTSFDISDISCSYFFKLIISFSTFSNFLLKKDEFSLVIFSTFKVTVYSLATSDSNELKL